MLIVAGVLISLAGNELMIVIAISLSIFINTLISGSLQKNVLSEYLTVPRLWIAASLGISLWFTGMYYTIWSLLVEWPTGFSMGVSLWVSGGIIGGIPQFFVLSKIIQRFGWWILVTFIALVLSGGTIFLAINLFISLQWFAFILALVLGGLVYGSVTGLYLIKVQINRSMMVPR
jgi:hypothetical protein